jgi:hypothetical protein
VKRCMRWDPDWKLIDEATEANRFATKGNPRALSAIHPLLLEDGSIVFNTGSVLVRQGRCTRKPMWILNGIFHHSNEFGP